jgi:hypothetical protein
MLVCDRRNLLIRIHKHDKNYSRTSNFNMFVHFLTTLGRKDIHSIMDTFERIIHPKNLFLLIPSAVLTYWMVMQLPPFFKKVFQHLISSGKNFTLF